MRRMPVILVALLLLLGACNQGTENKGISSNRPAAPTVVPAGPPAVVDIADLVEAPERYEGKLVQVSGQYSRLPVVVCDEVTRLSPATWVLGSSEARIGARGFEDLVKPLLPPGLMMTVEGVFRHWRGPVGCGKEAPDEDVWYVLVTNVIAPSPIARVTLTPGGQSPTMVPAPTGALPTLTPTQAGPEPIGTPVQPSTPTPTPTTAIPTATPTMDVATATSDAVTPLPSPTPLPTTNEAETATPTATSVTTVTVESTATATATATVTPSDVTPTIVDKGAIGYQDIRGDRLGSNEMHSWQIEVRSGDVLTISVAARLETDVAITVLDPVGNRVVEQNRSGAGQIEEVFGLVAGSSGTYRVVLSEAQGRETHYLMMLLKDTYADYYPFVFASILNYGSSQTRTMAAQTDDFWFFYGQSGEIINLNVSPNDNSDVFINLYGPAGERLTATTVNEATAGGAEQLLSYRLPSTGLFAIHVGEQDFLEANYTILVARN